jgi:hypothetical protein
MVQIIFTAQKQCKRVVSACRVSRSLLVRKQHPLPPNKYESIYDGGL